MIPNLMARLCLMPLLFAVSCERVVGFDTATIRPATQDADPIERDGGPVNQDAGLVVNCDQVAPSSAGQASTPLEIPRAPSDLSLAFPPADAWCRAPRVPIDKTSSSSDTKGSFRAMWSPDALWLLVTWQDDVWFTTNFFGYNNDGFYILIDPNASAELNVQSNDAQISVVVGSREISSVTEGAPDHSFPTADVKFETTGTTITWLLRFPWSEMNAPMAKAGQAIGLGVGVRDTDGADSTNVTWWHTARVIHREPRTWGAAVLR